MLVNQNFERLKPINNDEFLPPIQIWARLGGFALVGTAGVAIALIAFLPYSVVIKAPATVRPQGETKVVQAEAEGVVNQILVQENQVIKQGDAIAYLDDSQSQTQHRQLRSKIQQGQQQLTQIAAQVNALDRQLAAESSVRDRTVAAAEADLERNRREFQETQVAASTELQETQANVELAQDELKRYRQLARAQAVAKLQVKEKENVLKTALARLDRARSKVNPNKAPVTIATEQIAQAAARGRATVAKLRQEQEGLVSRKVEIENQLNRDRQSLAQLEHDRQRTVMRATTTGTVLKLELHNAGQLVRLGDTIAQISPRQSALIVKARVSAQDISQVKTCTQKTIAACQAGRVQMQIAAYPYPDYGTLTGAVAAIAPDVAVAQGNVTHPSTSYYDVTIQPAQTFLRKDARNYALKPGMDVAVEIISRQETVLKFLLRKARLITNW
jgi:HlyD family type I secretion membrane fusion protein